MFVCFLIFVVGFSNNLPLPGSFFIYLLEIKRMGGRALCFSMLCFMMRLRSKALCHWAGKLLHLYCAQLYFFFLSSLLCLLSFHLLLPPSCWPPIIFPFLRLSFQVFVINLYFVKGFCCTRFCILTESDWLLFSSPKSGFCSRHLSPSCPVTVLVLAPSISNVQTVLANQHQVYLMFR